MNKELQRAMTRARTQSKKWGTIWIVEHVVKGHNKGRYQASEKDNPSLWRKCSVVEVVATYKDGKKIKENT